jgi:hypothetical protein
MNELAIASAAFGGVLAALGAAVMAAPAACRRAADGFPRNRLSGWALTAVAAVWSALLLQEEHLGALDSLKPLLPLLTPVTILLVVVFLDELLAARALGAVLCLLPAPMLDAARGHPSPWRLWIVLSAYLMAIKGMALVLSPHLFRRTVAFAAGGSPPRLRWWGAACLAWGCVALVLAAAVFR